MKTRFALWLYNKALNLEPAIIIAHVNSVEAARQEGFQIGVKRGQASVLQHQNTMRQIASRN